MLTSIRLHPPHVIEARLKHLWYWHSKILERRVYIFAASRIMNHIKKIIHQIVGEKWEREKKFITDLLPLFSLLPLLNIKPLLSLLYRVRFALTRDFYKGNSPHPITPQHQLQRTIARESVQFFLQKPSISN